MAKQWFDRFKQKKAAGSATAASPKTSEDQLQRLLKQQQYRQALDEIKRIRRSNPDFQPDPSEAEIWLRRGIQEFQKDDFRQAETSFRRSLELGRAGEPHYWLARSLVDLNRLDDALKLIRRAFDDGSLPKDYSICYLKLLLLKGDTATVEQLITNQSKRFTAVQLHWIRGVLALKQNDPKTALISFHKIKRPLTPGDRPMAWLVYAFQAQENWTAAADKLGLAEYSPWRTSLDPIMKRLATVQQVKTGKPPLNPTDTQQGEQAAKNAKSVMAMIQLIENNNVHDAAHILLNMGRHTTQFPELAALRSPIMILAGQQAMTERQPQCAETFWKPLLAEQPFDAQLAVNLLEALEENESYQERQRLLTRLVNWVEQEAKTHPDQWSSGRLKSTLSHLHCYLADTWMVLGRRQAGLGALKQAERIAPDSPEVIGRKGLAAFTEGRNDEAVQLLTQALEGGCRYEEVYFNLLDTLDKLGNKQAKSDIRRRFGKAFGDLNIDTEIEVPRWIDALSTQTYPLFSHIVEGDKQPEPPTRACQIFVESTQGTPTVSSGRMSLKQEDATKAWNQLLKEVSSDVQVDVLQAIALSTHLFAKREKGIAALINRYTQKLFDLSLTSPAAREAHLIVLAVKESNPDKLRVPFQSYLDTQPQPGNALATLQLRARRFGVNVSMRPLIDEALSREPQNPLLLLAKATTYSSESRPYEDLRDQGFDLARRLQDAKALQAFREEQLFLNGQTVADLLPPPDIFDSFNDNDVEDLLERMIRQTIGKNMPKSELDRMMPELKEMILNSMPPIDDDDDDDDDDMDFGSIFGFKPPRKRKRSFRDL